MYQYSNSSLESVVSQMIKISRGIYNNTDLTAKERLRIIESLPAVVDAAETTLQENDYMNLSIFAEWFGSRYRMRTDLKTINGYASGICAFLDTLSSMEKNVTKLTDTDIIAAFQILKSHYRNPGVKTSVRNYIEFCASEYGLQLGDSIWRIKGTTIEELLTQRPLISYDLIKSANENALGFLVKRQAQSKNEEKIELKMHSSELIHKADQMKHAYSLSFFTGLRRNEVLTRKVSSIQYDDGAVLIIEEGKTDNSKRTIPLFLLMDDEYLDEFLQFVRGRKEADGPDAYLFVQEDGTRWDSNQFIDDIQDLFISLKIPDYVFHCNRGSFASWFLLRWFKVFHRDKIPDGTPFLTYDLFHDKYVNALNNYSGARTINIRIHLIFLMLISSSRDFLVTGGQLSRKRDIFISPTGYIICFSNFIRSRVSILRQNRPSIYFR